MITAAGVIGSGKSSLTKILSDELHTKPFFEPVEDNPVLPLFYKGNKLVESGRRKTNPYAFLLQVFFLNRRFKMIKEAMKQDNNVLDRSIYEDSIFMKMNYEQGHTTQEEWNIYQSLLRNMMEELPYAAHKKSPDLMVLIKVNYDTMINRIEKRGRKFEQIKADPSLVSYYNDLIARYEDWEKEYNQSPLLVIDGNKYDFVGNDKDRVVVLNTIESRLVDLGKITPDKFKSIKESRNIVGK
ncbi:deoxyguanosine kinase [Lactobacillus phage Lb338-1]|uniref:Deoxyguanosine kinase n=1 Tax=Lactobacillus phage Lb338-1 TaxID=2892342 RepID=C1KFI3_9CAUD|nr:thymidylate kinase [Lactobacillus phage Lb338-1]ACO36994.1 deoxyguanosine kinase [Lactobacillus phage Lb338-1]